MRGIPFLLVLVVGCGGATATAPGSSSTGTSAASGSAASSTGSSSSGASAGSSSSGSSGTGSSGSGSSTSGSSGSSGSQSTTSSSSTGSSSSSGSTSSGTTGASTSALLRPSRPMPCADPAVISEANAGQTYYVYCTSMGHVWKTTDWVSFSDVRSAVQFDLTGMSANGQQMGSWWAPALLYAPGLQEYVMWVSVPDAKGTNTTTSGWDTRSIAALTAPAPDGPWTFKALAIEAQVVGEHYIDPFLFRDHDGGHYGFWKQYGGSIGSKIEGARATADWTGIVASSEVELVAGYGGTGTWEGNVRENPAVWYDPATGHHHLLFSGGAWRDDTYATGHAVSTCGPLCTGSGGWHLSNSGDRGVVQVVQSNGNTNFTHGGPGGAVFLDATASEIIYAAAALSASGDSKRYLMRDAVRWSNDAPYVDTAHHFPSGF